MRGSVREIDSDVFYFPRPGEDTGNLMTTICNGNCLEPAIYDGDYLTFNPRLKPEIGDFVCYKGIGYRLQMNEGGQPILKNGHNTILPPLDGNYDGVVIQINRKLRGEK